MLNPRGAGPDGSLLGVPGIGLLHAYHLFQIVAPIVRFFLITSGIPNSFIIEMFILLLGMYKK